MNRNLNPDLKFDQILTVATGAGGNISLIKITCRVLTFAGLIFIGACSDSEPTNQVDKALINSSTSSASAEPIKSVHLDLTSTPIDKKAYLGLIAPEVKVAAACPFLSDETALATVKTDWILKRRETSNERCYWSKNLGFSIKVTVEPLATAKPVRERAYNLESPPVLKDQPEPGNNAVILYDTVWDNERPYAIAFEQDNKLVMIYVTGMATDADRLTATAKEIANKLPNAPVLDAQQNNAGSFDVCTTWSESDIEAIIGTPVEVTLGNLDCKWETATGEDFKQIRVTIYDGRNYPWESLLEQGAVEIAGVGERGVMERKRKRANVPGYVLLNALYEERLVTIKTSETISDHEAVALALSKNIDARFK